MFSSPESGLCVSVMPANDRRLALHTEPATLLQLDKKRLVAEDYEEEEQPVETDANTSHPGGSQHQVQLQSLLLLPLHSVL